MKTKLTNFQRAYLKLKKEDETKFYIEFYHNDDPTEPNASINSYTESIILDFVEDHGYIVSIFTEETIIGFSEKNYEVTVSDDVVVFTSKHEDNTYFVIHFT